MKKSFKFCICIMYCNLWISGAFANRMIYREPFDFQNVPPDVKSALPFSNAKFTSNGIPTTSQQIMHTGRMLSHSMPTFEQYNVKNSNKNLDGIFEMVNEIAGEETGQDKNVRTAAQKDASPNQHTSFGYSQSNYGQWPGYGSSYKGDNSPAPLQPKFSLIDSISSKSENKMNGLISLVLALLGSGQANPFGKGIKDVIINGIVRPLLVAKGGIKMIISRLAIPVVALILINVEVLITVWWLWDDCPVSKVMQPSPNPTYDYNSYNSSYY